jgi:hypothetical protein
MMPPELHRLFERFNQLGTMLPPDGEFPTDYPRIADVQILLARMHQVDEQIDQYLAKANNQYNVVLLQGDARYTARLSSAAAARMRRSRERKRAKQVVWPHWVIDESRSQQIVDFLYQQGLLEPWCEDPQKIFRAIEKHFELLCDAEEQRL